MDCQLCAARDEAYRVIFREDLVFAVVAREPINAGHLMVLPTRHAEQLSDLTPDEAAAFLQATDRCMTALAKTFPVVPMSLVNGVQVRTQIHLHAHVLPSYKGGLRMLYADSEGVENRFPVDVATMEKFAADLRPLF